MSDENLFTTEVGIFLSKEYREYFCLQKRENGNYHHIREPANRTIDEFKNLFAILVPEKLSYQPFIYHTKDVEDDIASKTAIIFRLQKFIIAL